MTARSALHAMAAACFTTVTPSPLADCVPGLRRRAAGSYVEGRVVGGDGRGPAVGGDGLRPAAGRSVDAGREPAAASPSRRSTVRRAAAFTARASRYAMKLNADTKKLTGHEVYNAQASPPSVAVSAMPTLNRTRSVGLMVRRCAAAAGTMSKVKIKMTP